MTLALRSPFQHVLYAGMATLVALYCVFSFAPRAQAASLTEPQISAIEGLLSSFGADQATINKVDAALRHGSGGPSSPPPPTGIECTGGHVVNGECVPSTPPNPPSSGTLSASCTGSPYIPVGAGAYAGGMGWSVQATGGSGAYTYQWTLANDVAWINPSLGGLQSFSAQVQYNSTGTKQASVVVSDGASSATATCSATIVGDVSAGSTSLSATPASGTAPLTVQFTGTALNPSYTLSFGDKSPSVATGCGECGGVHPTPISQSHTYTVAGTYTAVLTSNNQTSGTNTTARVTIVVSKVPPTPTPTPPTPTSPAAPAKLNAICSADNKTIYYSWPASSGATGYELHVHDVTAGTATQTYPTPRTDYSVPVTAGHVVYAWIYANNALSPASPRGDSAYTATVPASITCSGAQPVDTSTVSVPPLTSIKTGSAFWSALYACIQGRNATASELTYWTGQTGSGIGSLSAAYHSFFDSAEYTGKQTSNTVYLLKVYQCVLFRSPDSSGFNYWLTQLNSGYSRDAMLDSVLQSSEFKTNVVPTLKSATGLGVAADASALTAAAASAPDYFGSSVQFLADYSDAFNANLAAVVEAPFSGLVAVMTQFWQMLGVN